MRKIRLIISIVFLLFLVMSCGELPESFKVIYHSDGSTSGFAPTDPKEYKSGEYATVLDQHTLLKDGYNFDGWNTKADSTETTYKPGEKIKIKNLNIFLFPVWK
jgi:hypothetical protein